MTLQNLHLAPDPISSAPCSKYLLEDYLARDSIFNHNIAHILSHKNSFKNKKKVFKFQMKLLLPLEPPLPSPAHYPILETDFHPQINSDKPSATNNPSTIPISSSGFSIREYKSLESNDSNATRIEKISLYPSKSNITSPLSEDLLPNTSDLTKDIYISTTSKSRHTKKSRTRSNKPKVIPLNSRNLSPDSSRLYAKNQPVNSLQKDSSISSISLSTNSIILTNRISYIPDSSNYSSSNSSSIIDSSDSSNSNYFANFSFQTNGSLPKNSVDSSFSKNSYRTRSANKLKFSYSFDLKHYPVAPTESSVDPNLSLDFREGNSAPILLEPSSSSIIIQSSHSEYNITNRLALRSPISNTPRMLAQHEERLVGINQNPKLSLVGPNFDDDCNQLFDTQDTAKEPMAPILTITKDSVKETQLSFPAPKTNQIAKNTLEVPASPIGAVEPASPSSNNNMYGVRIGMDHANYVLMYNMLTGIRVSVSRCLSKMKSHVSPADFKASHKFSFDVVGDEQVPKLGCYDFKFKDYAPVIFSKIRSIFNLSGTDYLVSLTDRYILSEVGSSGKSGSFFYYSQDLRFIIKTVSKTEHKFMRVILKDYYEYFKNNPNTLLSRIYGLHRIKMPHGKKLHFIVMNNLFPPAKLIHSQFDLKGSFLGRRTLKHDPKNPTSEQSSVCLKDLDWIDLGKKLQIGPDCRRIFAEQLAKDVALLMRLKIMDYSLLVGVHDLDMGNSYNDTDISTKRRQTLSLFDPNITDLPLQMNSLSRAITMRNKVVRTDPIALTIPEISENAKKINSLITNNNIMEPVSANSADLQPNHDSLKRFHSVGHSDPTGSKNALLIKNNSQTNEASDSQPKNVSALEILHEENADAPSHNLVDLEGGIIATDSQNNELGFIYYLGVIDILTPYNSKKRAEHFFKSLWYSPNEQISAVNPKRYATRFLRFIYDQFDRSPDSEKVDDQYLDDLLHKLQSGNHEIKPRKNQ
ncbi:Phosphatidylinositol 4-phosphate 5-kinase its3 [Smittium mucronatum]|uniref:Phosphatidylinositol 4-phosphate 5-kinase its3 n=1 Tax=Smittium mucronatum TaxID=133383 RepID=A0A1R0GVC1_9FUNG|nr:Phosphatidylinositol 4-phosphate 5-kinase its3 [Smittium mucronatum]